MDALARGRDHELAPHPSLPLANQGTTAGTVREDLGLPLAAARRTEFECASLKQLLRVTHPASLSIEGKDNEGRNNTTTTYHRLEQV